jgi:MFS family permease
MDVAAINSTTPAPRAKGQLRDGLRYVRHTPDLAIPLLMMGVVGCLTYEFQVSLPVMASRGLHVGATGFGFMTAAMGVGAVIGGLLMAAKGKTGLKPLTIAATAFGIAMALATAAPTLGFELAALALAGAASITFMSTGNSTLQLTAEPAMRGRVMSLWFVAFQGSTPVGGPAIGAIMGVLGARAGLGLGALTCLTVAAGGALALAGRRTASASVQLQNAADLVQPVDQPRHILGRVVHREGRPRRGAHAQPAHQRLRAMVTRTHADAQSAQDLADVVRMGTFEREAD